MPFNQNFMNTGPPDNLSSRVTRTPHTTSHIWQRKDFASRGNHRSYAFRQQQNNRGYRRDTYYRHDYYNAKNLRSEEKHKETEEKLARFLDISCKEKFQFRTKLDENDDDCNDLFITVEKLQKNDIVDKRTWTNNFLTTMEPCGFKRHVALKWLKIATNSSYNYLFNEKESLR